MTDSRGKQMNKLYYEALSKIPKKVNSHNRIQRITSDQP